MAESFLRLLKSNIECNVVTSAEVMELLSSLDTNPLQFDDVEMSGEEVVVSVGDEHPKLSPHRVSTSPSIPPSHLHRRRLQRRRRINSPASIPETQSPTSPHLSPASAPHLSPTLFPHPPPASTPSSSRPPPPHTPPPLSHDKLRNEDSSEDDSTLSDLDSDDFEDIGDSDSDVSESDVDEDDRDEQDGEETLDDEAAPTRVLDAREVLKLSLIDESADNEETDVDDRDDTVNGKAMEVPPLSQGIMDPDSVPAETDDFIARLENARVDQSHDCRIEATPPPDPKYTRQPGEETSHTLYKAVSVPLILSADVAVYMAL